MRIELRLLGRFAALVQGTEPAVLPVAAPRLRAVLAYLAMQPACAETRERLAALLWGDSTDRQARQSLRQALVALRRELGVHADVLVVERETVGLAPNRIAADAREFLALAERGDPAAAARGLELYRGEFLDGIGRFVVEGSVRQEGETLRIDVALTDAKTRLQVWTQRFERGKAESFAMQDEIARGIARHLHIEMIDEAGRAVRPGAAPKPGAAEIQGLLARGWGAMLQLASAGTSSGADRYFEVVLKRDPGNVSALIGLGGYHTTVVAMFLVAEPEPHLAKAEALLARAVAKSPNSSMAHYFQGITHKTRAPMQAATRSRPC